MRQMDAAADAAYFDLLDEADQLSDFDDIDLASPRRRRDEIPRRDQGLSPNNTHWAKISNTANRIGGWWSRYRRVGERARMVDKDRRHGSKSVSKKRPDIQFYNPNRHRTTHIEHDTQRRAMNAHIQNRDPEQRNVFTLIDPRSGRTLEKRVYPVGANNPIVTYNQGLRKSDVFDEFEVAADSFGWSDVKRMGCRAKCAWFHGPSCTEPCGFDVPCIDRCTAKLSNCNADCDKRYS